MLEIEKKISPLVETLFPEFYRTEGTRFIAFVKAYYEWLEESSYKVNNEELAPKTLYYSRNIFDIRDIDKTQTEFLKYFKEKYLKGLTLNEFTDTRNLVKHSLELYRSKGSLKSVELFFSLLFNETIELYLPSEDILRVSNGEWFKPVYLEIEPNEKTKFFVGKTVTGASSLATAIVEGYAKRNLRGKTIEVIFLSSVSGNFEVGERLSTGIFTNDDPVVIGSLTNLTLVNKGRNFNQGDLVDLVSNISGVSGKGRISRTSSQTGLINYELIEGGTGYSNTANVIISQKVLFLSEFNNIDPNLNSFIQFEQVIQPLSNVEISSVQGNLLNSNTLIFGTNSTSVVSAGYVYTGNTTDTTKYLSISVHDIANAQIDSITNANTTGSFSTGESVYQISANTLSNSFVGTIVSANSSQVIIDSTIGTLEDGVLLIGVSSNCSANITSHVIVNGSFSDAGFIVTAEDPTVGNCVVTSHTNETANGLIVGSNSSAFGVFSITNNFRVPNTFNKAYVKNTTKSKTANLFFISSGNTGGFAVGSITDTESVVINTDFIGGNNAANVPYLSVRVDASNSGIGFVDSITINDGGTNYNNTDTISFTGGGFSVNAVATINTYSNGTIESITVTTPGSNYYSNAAISVSTSGGSGANLTVNMDFGYGFPKQVQADLNSIISTALTRNPITIGSISSLTGINPGSENNANPFVLIIENQIAGFGRRNFNLILNNVTKEFNVGEEVLQLINEPAVTIQVDNAGVFNLRETIEQTRSDANIVYGEIVSIDVTSNSGILSVKVSNTANTFDTSNTILGLETLSTANVVSVTSNNILATSKGEVLSSTPLVSNTVTLSIKRKSFSTSFTANVAVTGSSSGASGNVVSVSVISNSPIMGNNAIVSAVAGVANGTVEEVEVIDSGYAYRENELVTITNETNPFVATAQAKLIRQGVGEGFYLSTKGFLNSNKYIQDSRYYQEYSYEVKAGITLDKYSSILRELVHVAGTELFGSIFKVSSANIQLDAVASRIELEETIDLLLLTGEEDLESESGTEDLEDVEEPIIEIEDLLELTGTEDLETSVGSEDLETDI